MTYPELDNWQPLAPERIQANLGDFKDWCLCGGISVDLLSGRETRDHGDIDVGVFRSQLLHCLSAIGHERVYLCDPPGSLRKWDRATVPSHVNDIWIASPDLSHWEMQLLVFTDDETDVQFKRDPAVRWSKAAHCWKIQNYHVLNPAITMLYKSYKSTIEPKDAHDISLLIDVLSDAPDA